VLVLSRQKGESIVIDRDIIVCVIEIRGDKVRLGVNASPEISVHRKEVFDAIQRTHGERIISGAPQLRKIRAQVANALDFVGLAGETMPTHQVATMLRGLLDQLTWKDATNQETADTEHAA
jgi:carbon storage regulator